MAAVAALLQSVDWELLLLAVDALACAARHAPGDKHNTHVQHRHATAPGHATDASRAAQVVRDIGGQLHPECVDGNAALVQLLGRHGEGAQHAGLDEWLARLHLHDRDANPPDCY